MLYEKDNFITQMINRGATSSAVVKGGDPVFVTGRNTTDKELYTVAVKGDGVAGEVAIAFNPSVPRENGGYPALSVDDRKYTSYAIGDVIDIFFPAIGIEFGVTMENIDGTTEPTVGKFLEPKAGGKFEIKSSQTSSVPSFKVVAIETVTYPAINSFNDETQKVFIVQTVATTL